MDDNFERGYKQPTAVIDIDGVIAGGTREEIYSDAAGWCFEKCYPIERGIRLVNELKRRGVRIKLFTARHESDQRVTEKWLEKHGVLYDELIMGKPSGHIYIDDRAYLFSEESVNNDLWFSRNLDIILGDIKRWVVN
jgi:uncharacterized HAD superfamily protein